MDVESTGSSSPPAPNVASFRKEIKKGEIKHHRLLLQKDHFNTVIKPHLTPQQIDILNKGEGSVKVSAVHVGTGDVFEVSMQSAGYSFHLASAHMIRKMKFKEGDVIEVTWSNGALHILYPIYMYM
ncbi:hypothetical protein DITRI_Ditri03aG0076000 [Diplodiscus trichospermus]